jgi:hypothetical protein
MKRILIIVAAALMLSLLAGCAALNYGKYADKAAQSVESGEKTKTAIAKALGQAVASKDPRTRDQASMALLVLGLTHKTTLPEAPREGAVERGFGGLLYTLPGVATTIGVAREMRGANNSNSYYQSISGQGAGGAISVGGGSAISSPATSTPTVVTQPSPVIVGGE